MVKVIRFVLLLLAIAGSLLAVAVLEQSVKRMLIKEDAYSGQMMQKPEMIQLPVMVPGTTLVAQQISFYEGPFLEDGSDREVVDVAALHVYNAGQREIRNGCITLKTEFADYVFYGQHLPPGATVVLLEINARPYQKNVIYDCSGWQEFSDCTPLDGITTTDKDNGTLIVTNTTEQILENLCVYYKSWLSPPDVYMGGITYSIAIPRLLPGQSEVLYPYHYATGYSKVVGVVAQP